MSLKDKIVEVLKKRQLSAGHDEKHLLRVLRNGLRISKEFTLKKNVLTAALLLHDCDKRNEKKHAIMSAKRAKIIVEQLGFNGKEASIVFEAVKDHSRTDIQSSRKSIYSKIVYDADKLDGLGKAAIGRMQAIKKAKDWSVKQAAEWYFGRIADATKNEPLYFETSKRLSKPKLAVSINWCRKNLGKNFEQTLKNSGFEGASEIKL